MPPLHNRRRQMADRAERESAGEVFWSESFSVATRTRVLFAVESASGGWTEYFVEARHLILEDEGMLYLLSSQWSEVTDFKEYLLQCNSEMVPTVIEAFQLALQDPELVERTGMDDEGAFATAVNLILRTDRISFELIGEEMVPFASRELHVEVVEPVLRLLRTPGWEAIEAAYQSALGELSRGEGANAVTDAGTALQEALVLLGARGNALGPLIQSARTLGVIAGHDVALLEVLRRAAEWVSADRSVSGDTHNAAPASAEDAWLAVHIVGAILLRLSAVQRRA